jgi:antitoxin (DNA-binding transcriptional repressor) of toxin-antitoxin stability system
MHIVSISEMKAKLSKYLALVQNGAEVQIQDNGKTVARLVRDTGLKTIEHLVEVGVAKAPTKKNDWLLKTKPTVLAGKKSSTVAALLEDREDRF